MDAVFVLSTAGFDETLLAQIRAVSDRIVLVQHTASDATLVPAKAFERVEVLYTFGALPRPDQVPRLRWVQLNSAGVNHIVEHPLFATDVMFTTASGLHAIAIGEYIFASILAWARRFPELFDLQRKGKWPSHRWTRFVPSELRGATIGILGYGSIGREVARLAKAFGMSVLALKRQVSSPAEHGAFAPAGLGDPGGALPDRLYGSDGLREMLSQCDYVVLAVPLTHTLIRGFDYEPSRANSGPVMKHSV